MSKTKQDFITDFLFEVNGQFHQPDYDMLDSFYDLLQKEYEEKLRWIPVEEKLPEIDESLSKSDLHYSISVEVMNGVKIQSAYFNTENGKWRSLITGYIINPTHWRRFL